MIRVLIVDDHPIFRRGLRHLIEAEPGFSVVAEAGDLASAAQLLTEHQPQVAIIDLNLPNGSGLALVQQCRAQSPPTAPVVLTMHREESAFDAAISRGAAGYILKDNANEDVLLGLRAAANGGFYLSPSIAGFMTRRDARIADAPPPTRLTQLTPTERRVLRLIGGNRTTKEIAHELCISPRTVDTHRSHICEKLGLHGAQALLRFALENRGEL